MNILPFSIFGPRSKSGVLQCTEDVLSCLPFEAQWLNQVHGTELVEVKTMGGPVTADAMVSRTAGVRLLIKTADCIPVVLADEEAGLVAAVHAGWRGLTANIVPLTVQKLLAMGTEVKRLKIGIGPSLGTECAEFSRPYEEIPTQYHWAIREDRHVDLWGILEQQLRDAGVDFHSEQVEWMRVCTACNPKWFSWRRDHDPQRFGTWIELL